MSFQKPPFKSPGTGNPTVLQVKVRQKASMSEQRTLPGTRLKKKKRYVLLKQGLASHKESTELQFPFAELQFALVGKKWEKPNPILSWYWLLSCQMTQKSSNISTAREHQRKILDWYLEQTVTLQLRRKKWRYLMPFFFGSALNSIERPWSAWISELEGHDWGRGDHLWSLEL